MIQRIQTVYLLVSAILLVVPTIFNLNWATMETQSGMYQLTSASINLVDTGVQAVEATFPIAGAIGLALLLTVYSVMQYKDRKFQMKLVQAAMLLNLVAGGVVFFYADRMAALSDVGSLSYAPIIGVFPVNAMLCFLGYRAIKKDDDLVRSADRLR